jgi:hypothetical protein
MENAARLTTKALLLIYATMSVLYTWHACCEFVAFGSVPIRPFTAFWMFLSITITVIREFREGYYPYWMTIPEFALCLVGLGTVISSLSLAFYDHAMVPSPGTTLGFTIFWAVHMLLQIERVRHLKALYSLVVLVGVIGIIGHLTGSRLLMFQLTDAANAVALPTCVFLILLGLAAYSRERQGP